MSLYNGGTKLRHMQWFPKGRPINLTPASELAFCLFWGVVGLGCLIYRWCF